MKIGGPFLDPQRRKAKKKWYLSYFVPRVDAAGAPILREGKTIPVRKRPYYRTKDEAEADKPRLLAQFKIAGGSSDEDGTGGLLSREQTAEFHAAKKIAPEIPLPEMAQFWRKHHPLQSTAKVGELAKDFLKSILGRVSDRHYSDLKYRVPAFAAAFADRIPVTLTRAEILTWLQNLAKPIKEGGRGLTGRTVLNIKRGAVNFLNWLVETEVIATNPIGRLRRRQLPPVIKKEILFLSIDYVRRYLAAAELHDPELVAHEVIQLFSGVRADDEMADFDGKWVLPQTREVVIPAEIAKIDTRREVIAGLEENFWAWWEAYGRVGVLRPRNYIARWKRLRVLTELDRARADELGRLPIKTLLDLPEAGASLKGWVWNARRRTFCTYHVAKHQSAEKTALILRHNGGASTLHNSYRGLGITQAQGAEFFSILPSPAPRPEPIRPGLPERGAFADSAPPRAAE